MARHSGIGSHLFLCTLVFTLAAIGRAQTFEGLKYATNDSKEINVRLTVNATGLEVQRQGGPWSKPDAADVLLKIPFASVGRLSYGFTNHKRALEALAGGLMALAVTSPLHHWLLIESQADQVPPKVLLRLPPGSFRNMLEALTDKSGKKVELLDARNTDLDPTAGSHDVDEVIPLRAATVLAAVQPAMESVSCKVHKASDKHIECQRRHTNVDRTGFGGETMVADLEAHGESTRLRIVTGKPGLRLGKNWSTPVYREIRKRLGLPVE